VSLAAKLRRAPLRLTAGAYILNSGVGKLKVDEQTAGYLHHEAVKTLPAVSKVKPGVFAKGLTYAEIAVGGALLAPFVPAGLAGLALTAFAGSLVAYYVRSPEAHDDKYRPVGNGVGLAKDVFLLGIGTALVVDAALSESPITNTES
jgi:hypothetical protein